MLLINQQLAGEASVTESIELRDRVTGRLREVDILIQGKIGDYDATIAVEYIDWRKPTDVIWIESIYQKHQNLTTDKVILVSRSGYSKPAIEKAEFYNMEALSLEAAEGADWGGMLGLLEPPTLELEIVSHEIQNVDKVIDAGLEPATSGL
jgi:hypothetical protein